MDKQQAFQLVSQVCSIFKGTAQEHSQIQLALKTINTELNSVKKK